jgi:hypothetical protein
MKIYSDSGGSFDGSKIRIHLIARPPMFFFLIRFVFQYYGMFGFQVFILRSIKSNDSMLIRKIKYKLIIKLTA